MLYITTPAFTLNMLSMADTLYATDDCTFTDSIQFNSSSSHYAYISNITPQPKPSKDA